VEVGPGDLYGAEYSGKSQVLNVILSAQGGFDGTVTASARRIYTGDVTPNASASAMFKRGPSTFNLSAGADHSYQFEEGTDTLVDADSGAPIEHRRKINSYRDFNPFLSGSWALEHAKDRAIRLNARWALGRFDLEQRNRVTPAGGAPHDDALLQDYDNPVFEIGGDITRPLAGGSVKLVGLATRRKRDNFDAYFERNGLLEDEAVTIGGFEQTQKAKRNETIARLSWTRQDLAGFSFEAGGEAVLNTLDSEVDLFVIDEGERVRIDLPIDNATVKEKRGEAFVNIGRSLSPALRVDAGVTFEYSQLSVRGDTTADRTLKFLKPQATIDWKPGGGWHTQLALRRTVAQLDFFDFISAAELSTDRVNAGNANLLPQRAWEVRLTVDRPILGNGLVKIDLGPRSGRSAPGPDPDLRRKRPRLRRAWQYRHRQAQLCAAHGRCAAQNALERPQGQVQRRDPAHARRGPDQRRDAQLQRLLSRLGMADRGAPRFRRFLLRLRRQRPGRVHFLPHRRVGQQSEQQPLRDRIRGIPARPPHRDHSRRRQCDRYRRQPRKAAFPPQSRRAPANHQRASGA
jgi:hypothetical protein